MPKQVALFISVLFHPVFVNALSFVTLLYFVPTLSAVLSTEAKLYYIAFLFVSTSLIPVFIILILKIMGSINSILLNEQQDRNIPYLITATLYLIDYYFLSFMQYTPNFIRAYVLACACIVVVVVIVNHFYKISIHAASLGAWAGVLCISAISMVTEVRFILISILLLSGITLSARVFLKVHTLAQVYWGWALGFTIMFWLL
jgi:hypothetical protein